MSIIKRGLRRGVQSDRLGGVKVKAIPIASLKGGVGKSTITAQLGKALRRRGHKVALLDLDIHGPNLHLALGLSHPPPLELDTAGESIIPNHVDGVEFVTLASHFAEGTRILWKGEAKLDLVREMLEGVIAWDSPDYLLFDCPPTLGDEVQALFENLPNPHGVVLVTQPSDLSVDDASRLLDMLAEGGIPLIGLVANMDGALCPHCNHRFYPFASRRVDIEQFCKEHKLPFLMSIPQVTQSALLTYTDKLARLVDITTPVRLPIPSIRRKLKRQIAKKVLEVAARGNA